jgi:YycE-like protein
MRLSTNSRCLFPIMSIVLQPLLCQRHLSKSVLVSCMETETILRVARPTNHLDHIVRFYIDGVGLIRLGAFEDHDGFDGVMLGLAGAPYHFEFTRKRGHLAGAAPTQDNLLVFYLPEIEQWQAAVDRMVAAGYEPVPSFNPYWDRAGRTFEDPDGYRIVFQNAHWPGQSSTDGE